MNGAIIGLIFDNNSKTGATKFEEVSESLGIS
jgi:hypothetical protein